MQAIRASLRKEMIEPDHAIPIKRQCELFAISRGLYYYQPVELTERDLEIINKIDELYVEDPTRGIRRMRSALRKKHNIKIGRDRIRRFMQILGVRAIYPKKNTSISNKEHNKYPYLLRGLSISHPNHVWGTDITYIRLKRGFVYLVAIIDIYSRYVLSWKLSTTLDRGFCIEALNEAINKYGAPKIFNSDQGCQFTSTEFTEILSSKDISISMNGKGRALDNIHIERLWRTVKYQDIYLNEYRSVKECKEGLTAFFKRYNSQREHQALKGNYPEEVYFGKINLTEKAA